MYMPRIQNSDSTGKVDEATAFNIPELGILRMVDEKIAKDGHPTRGSG
jgi:hypothetical protein